MITDGGNNVVLEIFGLHFSPQNTVDPAEGLSGKRGSTDGLESVSSSTPSIHVYKVEVVLCRTLISDLP